ncbi:hypothetical protein J6590_051673 [Homalodisca vitripennis]|nr:hypothetical protein J6590_051673 [Homalodisca vitripennis]
MRFFLRGYVKNIVYSQKIRDLAHLKERIYEAVSSVTRDVLHSVWAEIDHRLDVCRAICGGHIEILHWVQKKSMCKRKCRDIGVEGWIDMFNLLRRRMTVRGCSPLPNLTGDAGAELTFSSSKVAWLRFNQLSFLVVFLQKEVPIPILTHPDAPEASAKVSLISKRCRVQFHLFFADFFGFHETNVTPDSSQNFLKKKWALTSVHYGKNTNCLDSPPPTQEFPVYVLACSGRL